MDLAISQEYLQQQALRGVDVFESEGPNSDIVKLLNLHTEIMLLAARKDAGIHSVAELKGKTVNLGNAGSGTQKILLKLLEYLGYTASYFGAVTDKKSGDLPMAFCDKEIDAAIYSTGHPNRIYSEFLEDCNVTLVDLWDNGIRQFVEQNAEFVPSSLLAATYNGQEEPVKGFGIPVILSATTAMPETHRARLMKIVGNNHDRLIALNPVFKTMEFK